MLDTPPPNNLEERIAKPKLSGTWRSSFGFLPLAHWEHLEASAALGGRSCGQGYVAPADSPAAKPAHSYPQPPAWQAQAGARAGLEGEVGGSGASLLCEEELSPRLSPSEASGASGQPREATADAGLALSLANEWTSSPIDVPLLTPGNSPGGSYWRLSPFLR
jgi:hypothetical protein